MNPVPSIDDLTPSLQAKPKIVPPPMQPLPPAMASIPTPAPSMPPPLQPLVKNGSIRGQQENFYTNAIGRQQQWLTPHPSEPGFWHKLGHIANTIRNVAETGFAPNLAANDPTNPLYHELRLNADQRALAGLQSQDQREQQNAETNAQREQQLEIEQQRANQEGQPKPDKYTFQQTDHGLMRIDNETGEAEPVTFNGQPLSPVAKPTAEAHDAYDEWLKNPQQYEAYIKAMNALKPSEKGAYGSFGPAFLAYHMLNSAYNDNPALLPVIAPILGKMFSSAGAANPEDLERVISKIPAGQPSTPSGQAIGLRQPGAPTGATRSRGQFAESIMPSIQTTKQEIASLGNDLGPMQGRWNELYTGKVGAFGPEFTQLQTNLKNIGTAWMRLHANSETARQEFEQTLRAAQSPANLEAALDAIGEQAHDYVLEGRGEPNKLASFTVPEGAPSAPKEDGKYLYADGKPIAKSEGGKWVAP